jgi:hypothetical protein
MGTLLTGEQDTPTPYPATWEFFFIFFAFFFGGKSFFFEKKCVPICLILSRCTRTLGILWFNVFHQRTVVIMTKNFKIRRIIKYPDTEEAGGVV